ncbi:hypothetical protein [Collinsella stercoris]|uniref:hypothetical protein n=1 Tax=Collinsella stercoris TaxID=147206 RepID=UPI003A930E64
MTHIDHPVITGAAQRPERIEEHDMHDVGMNMGQLEMSIKQVDDAIALAREWSHTLLHATETYDMERIGGKLETAMGALDEARSALEGYQEAIEADHNAVGTIKLV